ncbi:family 10 glycosylhydrolase, partial [Verrucomicrobiota bacterium]
DYVRYPDVHACFCSGCRKRFEKSLGRRVHKWPESVVTGKLRGQYTSWRCDRITDFVRSVRKRVRGIRPDVKISAAVYQTYPACKDSVGQDWGRWLEQGLVDFVCPMDYVSDAASFRDMVRWQLAMPGSKGRLFPGIGVTSSKSRLAPDQIIDQINTAREAGAGGFVLFDLNRVLEKDVLPVLNLGVTRKDAPQVGF